MILLWDHSHGKQEQQDLVVCRPYALPEAFEEAEMLDNGWLALDRPVYHEGKWREAFYQCRSTRVQLSNYTPPKRQPMYKGNPIQMMEIVPEKNFLQWTGMQQVYKTYLKNNGFRDLHNPLKHISDRDTFLLYYQGEVTNILGFTKIKRYWYQEELMSARWNPKGRHSVRDECGAIESVIRACTVPITKITLEMELTWAKRMRVKEFYIGAGYEQSSIYKAHIPGFEWWTGARWSRNQKKYIALCERDSTVNLIQDLKN